MTQIFFRGDASYASGYKKEKRKSKSVVGCVGLSDKLNHCWKRMSGRTFCLAVMSFLHVAKCICSSVRVNSFSNRVSHCVGHDFNSSCNTEDKTIIIIIIIIIITITINIIMLLLCYYPHPIVFLSFVFCFECFYM